MYDFSEYQWKLDPCTYIDEHLTRIGSPSQNGNTLKRTTLRIL